MELQDKTADELILIAEWIIDINNNTIWQNKKT